MTYVAPPYLNGGSPVFVDFDVRVTDGFGCPDEQTVSDTKLYQLDCGSRTVSVVRWTSFS